MVAQRHKPQLQLVEGVQASQRLPRISQAPDKLREILAVVDLIPVLEELPDLGDQTVSGVVAMLKELGIPEFGAWVLAERFKVTAQTLEDFKPLQDPVRRYYRGKFWSEALRKIVKRDLVTGIQSVMWVNSAGRVVVSRNALAEVLDDLDIRHLRECARCHRIFWAKKLKPTQLNDHYALVGCTERCKHYLRVKKSRAEAVAANNERKTARPNKHILAAVQRAMRGWPNLYSEPFPNHPTTKHIRELAEVADVTQKQCKAALEHLPTQKRAKTARKR